MDFKISGTYTDLYQLAMGQALYLDGGHNMPASFDYFFRKIPFKGGYVIFAGLANAIEIIKSLEFSSDDIAYLADQGFDKGFLETLKTFKFNGSIHAPKEGEIIFPTETVLRVEGTMLELQLVETLLLNILNFQSLIATKASRIRYAAKEGAGLSEFGMRRAQGYGASIAARAAVIGGCDSTSNVYAAEKYGLACAGTMAHSFIQFYDDELQAFRKFAEANPDNSTFLVDTYDTLRSGVPNAIKVAKEMEEQGRKLNGVRLDSGDLAYLSHKTRKMLDDAGLDYVKIAASNQLDEYVIRSLNQQNAPIDIFGVGTNLVTGHPDAALDGVYKLVMANNKPRIKVSENLKKTTLPGNKQVYRIVDENGYFRGIDAIAQENEGLPKHLTDPFDARKSMQLKTKAAEKLLTPVIKNGEILHTPKSVNAIKQYAVERFNRLPAEFKRFENPHVYKVGISDKTLEIRNKLRQKHKQNANA